jgi:hypothetical protein
MDIEVLDKLCGNLWSRLAGGVGIVTEADVRLRWKVLWLSIGY